MDNRQNYFSRRHLLGGGAAIGATGILPSCGFDEEPGGDGGADGGEASAKTARFRMFGSVLDSLDPHYVNDALYYVAAGLLEGLVLSNDDVTDVVPAAAESWEVSEDQLTYTFTMREGATWSNGDPVTAGDAEASFQRVLTPTGAGSTYSSGSSSYLPGLGIRGATEYTTGEISDWSEVGISAPDDRTVVIELEVPNPDFLIGMSHYSMLLVHVPSIEEHETEWMLPENWVGNGPYNPVSWNPTSSLQLAANESYWDYNLLQIHAIELVLGMDPTAAQVSFQSGDLDITIANEVAEADPALESNLVVDPGFAVKYVRFMYGGHEAVRDVRVRQAMSLAIIREEVASLRPAASEPGTSLIPGNVVEGWDESLATTYDVDGARALMSEAGYDTVPTIRLQSNAESPLFTLLLNSWQEAFDAEIVNDVLEAGVHSESLSQGVEDDSLIHVFSSAFGGISTMNNWISNIYGPEYIMRSSLVLEDLLEFDGLGESGDLEGAELAVARDEFLREHSDPEAVRFAELVTEAQRTLDSTEQLNKFLEAAQVREDCAWVLPVSWDATTYLVSDRISGFAPRPSPERAYYKYMNIGE